MKPRRGQRRTVAGRDVTQELRRGTHFASALADIGALEVVRRAGSRTVKAFHSCRRAICGLGMTVPVLDGNQVREVRVASARS